jgi:hypothetical protein
MKKIILLSSLLALSFPSIACESSPVNVLVVGDSQTGATWAKSYFGNFLQECLGEDFMIFGKGGSILSSWLGKGGLDNIQIIQRDSENKHLNLGQGEQVPLCKKRFAPMIDTFAPQKFMLFFGDNYIASSDEQIILETTKTLDLLEEKGIRSENCFFLTPTFEMEVATKRNVTRKNYENTLRISNAIKKASEGRCTIIDGLEIMKNSPYYLSNKLLKRVHIPGNNDCAGAASNDNIHICGEAARDLAEKVCQKLR